ncbi:MAG: hypothetical protein WDN75_21225 [Bacteroidota bacterium]
MFINKIRRKESGILLYGITPPKAQTTSERITEIAEKTIGNLSSMDIDALVVYDVQDESAQDIGGKALPILPCARPVRIRKPAFAPPSCSEDHLSPCGKIFKG